MLKMLLKNVGPILDYARKPRFIIKQIERAKRSPFARFFYYGTLALAGFVIAVARYEPAIKTVKLILAPTLIPFLSYYKAGIFLSAILWVLGLPLLKDFFFYMYYHKWCPQIIKNKEDVELLLGAVDAIAGRRLETLGSICTDKANLGCRELLERIAQTDVMNYSIFSGIREYFERYIREKGAQEFSMSVIECKDGKMVEEGYYFWYPTARIPPVSISELANDNSIAREVFKARKLKVVPSLENEKSYLKYDDPDLDKGSMLCYPFLVDRPQKEMVFIITLQTSTEYVFDKADKPYYNKIMESFALRVRLEHQFAQIRSRALKEG